MATCNGKGLPECEGCVNAELDPFRCRTCEGGSNWEGSGDDSEWLTIHEFKDYLTEAV
jgi:hypothetical protein